MIGFVWVAACALAGFWLAPWFPLPVPGPVLGLGLMLILLLWRPSLQDTVRPAAGLLLQNLALFLVPLAVAVLAQEELAGWALARFALVGTGVMFAGLGLMAGLYHLVRRAGLWQ